MKKSTKLAKTVSKTIRILGGRLVLSTIKILIVTSIIVGVGILYAKQEITYSINVGALDYIQVAKFNAMDFLLRTIADSNDVVNITIDSPGGSVYMASDFIHAIRQSEAKVNIKVTKMAASAGALIMLTGDTLQVDDKSFILFHRPYFTVGGIFKVTPPDDRGTAMVNDLVMNRVIPLLTPQERTDYILGRDITMSGKELKRRLQILKDSQGFPLLPTPLTFGIAF